MPTTTPSPNAPWTPRAPHSIAMRIPVALAALALLACVVGPSFAADPAILRTITTNDLRGHVSFLCSEELEGRGLGEAGGRTAQRYLASYYTRLGLTPFGEDGTFFQPFEARGRNGRNVLAMLPGTDPALRGEFIVVMGHVDHLGRGRSGDGPVYNGADDNASGTAAILEIAEAFTAAPPRRSVVFFNTDGEESGLLGSRHWIENPTFPLESVAAVLCMDMIGRSEDGYVFVGGTGTAPEFPELVESLTKDLGLKPEIAAGGKAPTDSMVFYQKEKPILFFFTNLHNDYHMPTDDIEKLDFDGLTRITKLIYLVGADLANADDSPEFTEADQTALPATFGQRMRDRMANARANSPYLGVEPSSDADASEPGFVVGAVAEGSAAETAGLKAGDRIVAIGETEVGDFRDLRRALGGRSVGDTVRIEFVRGEETLTVDAELGSMGSR